MSAKKHNHGKTTITRTPALVLAAGAVCVGILVGWLIWSQSREPKSSEEVNLGQGLSLVSVEAYSGPFWEDGTDRAVENVWQITLRNTSQQDIQYLKLTAQREDGTSLGEFEITTLTAGSTIQVLEAAATAMPDTDQKCTYHIEHLAYLQHERSLHTDIFTLSVSDQWIKLENHSQQKIDGDIYVYYKRVEDGVLNGGITYRVKFSGGLGAGESQEQQTMHFDPDNCEIMYLEYQ